MDWSEDFMKSYAKCLTQFSFWVLFSLLLLLNLQMIETQLKLVFKNDNNSIYWGLNCVPLTEIVLFI